MSNRSKDNLGDAPNFVHKATQAIDRAGRFGRPVFLWSESGVWYWTYLVPPPGLRGLCLGSLPLIWHDVRKRPRGLAFVGNTQGFMPCVSDALRETMRTKRPMFVWAEDPNGGAWHWTEERPALRGVPVLVVDQIDPHVTPNVDLRLI